MPSPPSAALTSIHTSTHAENAPGGSDCVCPLCVEFEEALHAWHINRANWHRELPEGESCGCPDCDDPLSAWREASKSFSSCRMVCLCPKAAHPGLELPHAPEETPEFYQLRCCMKPPGAAAGARPYPSEANGHLPACARCGWTRKLASGKRCKVTYSSKPVSWRRYKMIPTGDRREESKKLVTHKGTRAELMGWLEENSLFIFYHLWLKHWMWWQKKLLIATFDAIYEMVVIFDWAAVYEMKGDLVGTCERPISCKQFCAIVLSQPGETQVGVERAVRTDYWRWWTDCSQNARVNMLALRELVYYYKYGTRWSVPHGKWSASGTGTVPNLKRMCLIADGSTTQNKGRKFFGREVQMPHPDRFALPAAGQKAVLPGRVSSWGCNVGVSLEVGAPHHNSGTIDAVGKEPRRGMDDAVLHDRMLTIFDFAMCYWWCVKNMRGPSLEHAHTGTFGCTGSYFWGAFTTGEFPNPDAFPVVDATDESDWNTVDGSRQLFCFRASHEAVNELTVTFVSCHCVAHRRGDDEQCPYRHIVGNRRFEQMDPKPPPRRRRKKASKGDRERDWDDTESD